MESDSSPEKPAKNQEIDRPLPQDFKDFLESQILEQQAWAMVDAQLEVDPDLDTDLAFDKTLALLRAQEKKKHE